jgi:hypothetical protein
MSTGKSINNVYIYVFISGNLHSNEKETANLYNHMDNLRNYVEIVHKKVYIIRFHLYKSPKQGKLI